MGKTKKRSLILRLNDFGVLSNWEEGNSKFEKLGGKFYPRIFVVEVSPRF